MNIVKNKKIPYKKNYRVERTRNGGTMTESAFWVMIRTALRNKSRFWKPINDCKIKARRPYKGQDKRQKWEYQCKICKDWFKYEQIHVDHIHACGELNSFNDLPGFVERLFVEVDGLQCLCHNCHAVKTKDEKVLILEKRQNAKSSE